MYKFNELHHYFTGRLRGLNYGYTSFSYYFLNELLKGDTFETAFSDAAAGIKGWSQTQAPQQYDSDSGIWGGYLAGQFASASTSSLFKSYTGEDGNIQMSSGSTLTLDTTIDILNNEGVEVYAVITPPFPEPTDEGGDFETPVAQQIKVDLSYQGETNQGAFFGGDKLYSGQSQTLTSPGGYMLTYYLKDSSGDLYSADPVSFQVGGAMDMALDLTNGWNLLGIYLEPSDGSIGGIFSGANETIISAWKWVNNSWAVYLEDYTEEQFTTYITAKGFASLTDIANGEGFWVNAKNPLTLNISGAFPQDTALSVSSGWNLMSLKGNQTKLITTLVSGNQDSIASLWKWENGTWAVFLPGQEDNGAAYAGGKGFTLLEEINPGEGFWVNADVSVTLD